MQFNLSQLFPTEVCCIMLVLQHHCIISIFGTPIATCNTQTAKKQLLISLTLINLEVQTSTTYAIKITLQFKICIRNIVYFDPVLFLQLFVHKSETTFHYDQVWLLVMISDIYNIKLCNLDIHI